MRVELGKFTFPLVARLLCMTLSLVHVLWTAGPLWGALCVVLSGVWLSIVGCVRRYQRHVVTRMILREAQDGSRVVYLTRRAMSLSACIIEVPAGRGACTDTRVLPPARQMRVI
ncbi:hypothetical protein ACW9HR_36450 [Nocardia gipuzkoensis]